ncbi:MAG: nitroreductase family protein [[Clostridium] scindens]
MIGTMNQEKLHQAFEIPEERIVRLIVTVGYPAKEGGPRKKARKDLEEIVQKPIIIGKEESFSFHNNKGPGGF